MARIVDASLLMVLLCACSTPKRSPPLQDYIPSNGGDTSVAPDPDADAPPAKTPPRAEIEGALSTKNSAGRTGAFFLPAGYNTRAFPLLVAYHGSDQAGSGMLNAFRALAITRGFMIVAPDSRMFDGHFNWQVGDQSGDVTDDYTHTLACIAEVRAKEGVTIDETRVLAAGFSGGGSSAPYIATNEPLFKSFAVLHGGVIQGGIGTNVIQGWFSTGQDDPARPPSLVQQSVDYIQGLGFSDVVFRIYPGGHVLSDAELADVVAWWLGS